MIIVRSPLRITLGGGGTDLPSYYLKNGGYVISAAIDKYIYTTITRPFEEGIYLKYSDIESVNTVDEIQHPIFKEALKRMQLKTPQIEITTVADIPSGTGLGSSSSFTVGLLKALYSHRRKSASAEFLADKACSIEIDSLNAPIGKQDQYIAAFGGITELHFQKGHMKPNVTPLNMDFDVMCELEENLLLFFTGFTRSANTILKDQDDKTKNNNDSMIQNLDFVKKLGFATRSALKKGSLFSFVALMNQHWENKKARTKGMTNPQIDKWYELGMNNGALGGKLVGAGGGGFLLFYAKDKEELRTTMKKEGLEEVRFHFDFEGAKRLI